VDESDLRVKKQINGRSVVAHHENMNSLLFPYDAREGPTQVRFDHRPIAVAGLGAKRNDEENRGLATDAKDRDITGNSALFDTGSQ
jgi:hypothetical protein